SESRFKVFRSLVCTASLLLVSAQVGVQAQTVQVDRAQWLQSQTAPPYGPNPSMPGVEDGHAAASPNDTDLGEQQILQRAPEHQPMTFSVGTPVFYTSNVALTPTHEMGDVVVAPVAGLYYDPQICKNLYGHFGAREQVFYYGKYNGFDFGSLDAEAGLSYVAPQ